MWLPVQDHTSLYSYMTRGSGGRATASHGGLVRENQFSSGTSTLIGCLSPSVQSIPKYMQAALTGLGRFHRHSKTMIITEQEDMNLRGTRGVGSGEEAVDMMKIHPMNF